MFPSLPSPWGNIFKFGINVHDDSRLNRLDFGHQSSEVKITVTLQNIFGKKSYANYNNILT